MTSAPTTPFLGLAPFLRQSIAGKDLRPIAQSLLEQAGQAEEDAQLWMNLATALFSIGQRDMGLAVQQQALLMQSTYLLPATRQPAKFRLLLLMAAGDLSENAPLDCLLEDSAIDLIFHYASLEAPLPADLPDHDALFVAMSYTRDTEDILTLLRPLLADWEKPVINAPQFLPNTERRTASDLLQGIPGLSMPPTRALTRTALQAIADGKAPIDEVFADCRFPIILRPVGSQAGRDLARIDDPRGVGDYLGKVDAEDFYLSRFIDYSGADGLFRKYRIALIAGQPFACHMGISAQWMIHYLNAGMYEDSSKRTEEESFMTHFAAFAERHGPALTAIYRRAQLDYLCIDCAETRDGELLIFEIDHAMVVHAMDPADLFPYKQIHMQKVRQAFEAFLFGLAAARLRLPPTLPE